MGLSKHRNQACACESGKKFKFCCLPTYYNKQAEVVTPIQRQEKAKEQVWCNKRYEAMTGDTKGAR